MSEVSFHPNAYIPSMRNKKSGLRTRTTILNTINKGSLSIRDLVLETKINHSTLQYHLRLLEKHNLIQKKTVSKRKIIIEQTGLGQKAIHNFVIG